MFTETVNFQKQRIMNLPAYTAAHKRFNEYLQDIEQYKATKIKEMQEDQEYQKNFSDIKNEIQRSSELCKQNTNLSKEVHQDILREYINRRRDHFHSEGRHVARRLAVVPEFYTLYDIFLRNLYNNSKKKLITYHKNSDIKQFIPT